MTPPLVLTTLLMTTAAQAALDLSSSPPRAEKQPKDVTVHGDERVDEYFWLRERENPAVRTYLEAENAYTERVMAASQPLRERLFAELKGRIKETDQSAPAPHRDWLYYSRTEEGKQYKIYARKARASADATEELLLDLNRLAEGHAFLALGDYDVSDDDHLLAYSLDDTGYCQFALQVRDLRTGKPLLPEPIERVTSVAWSTDNDTLFFVQEDPVAKRSYLLSRVSLATGKIETLYEEKDDIYDIELSRSLDGRYIFCTSTSKETSEVRALRADHPTEDFRLLLPREDDHEYYAEHRDGLFYFVTNKDAENFRIVTAPVDTPDVAHWTDFVPHNPAVRVESIELFAGHAVVSELEAGLPFLRVIDLKTGDAHRIRFPEPAYEAALDLNLEFDTTVVRFNYQSPVTPASIFDYDMVRHARTLVKQQEVLGGFNAANYTCERIFATTSDGTRVPITVVYRRDLRKEGGPRPLLLYGYGSYGYSLPDAFSSNRVSLLDRGIIYAIAHIRGGGEMGEAWHDHGKMKEKMNTFTDFIACAEHLTATGYTTAAQLAAEGGSAGGLLVGAVLNLRPDLWRAAIVDVPFVDVINTMLDASLPLTTSEYLEWGNPNVKEEYGWMRAYSPYDNIKPQPYPHSLINVSFHDSQVPYWEGAKLAARLRATKTDDNTLLLKTNFDAGHGGASGRYDALKEVAFDYAFLLAVLGIE